MKWKLFMKIIDIKWIADGNGTWLFIQVRDYSIKVDEQSGRPSNVATIYEMVMKMELTNSYKLGRNQSIKDD